MSKDCHNVTDVLFIFLQINRSPSFGTDEKIDFDIKSALIEDTVRLLNIK